MKQRACIIIHVFKEVVPHCSYFPCDLVNEMSISNAQKAQRSLPIWGWSSKLPFGRNIPAVNQLPHCSDLQATVRLLLQTPSLMLRGGLKWEWSMCNSDSFYPSQAGYSALTTKEFQFTIGFMVKNKSSFDNLTNLDAPKLTIFSHSNHLWIQSNWCPLLWLIKIYVIFSKLKQIDDTAVVGSPVKRTTWSWSSVKPERW